jgi:hypothetical protein
MPSRPFAFTLLVAPSVWSFGGRRISFYLSLDEHAVRSAGEVVGDDADDPFTLT